MFPPSDSREFCGQIFKLFGFNFFHCSNTGFCFIEQQANHLYNKMLKINYVRSLFYTEISITF